MLEVLCGNKSVQKILFFLFVNGTCYGTQLHRFLKTPLTPLQKALLRLERGGVITSYCEGKTRLYQFNPSFPLLTELEGLLKKAYTLLPAQEKKDYYVIDSSKASNPEDRSMGILMAFWEKLSSIKQLSFVAKTRSKGEGGWNGEGTGDVRVVQENDNMRVFYEKGMWKHKEGVNFSNVFRWTLDRSAGVISLEHLRRGADHPVFLFHLAPSSRLCLTSVDSHLCGGDSYFGKVYLDRRHVRLHWRIIGPQKNEELNYYYS